MYGVGKRMEDKWAGEMEAKVVMRAREK